MLEETADIAMVKPNQVYTLTYGGNGYAHLYLVKDKWVEKKLGKFKIVNGCITIPDVQGYGDCFEIWVIYFKENVCMHKYGKIEGAKDNKGNDFVFKKCKDCGYIKSYNARKI